MGSLSNDNDLKQQIRLQKIQLNKWAFSSSKSKRLKHL